MKYNFHTHSYYDDGRLAMEDYVVEAIGRGFDALGFSGHSPLPDENVWSIKAAMFPDYVAACKRLKHQYRDQIDLFLGLEIDYIPGLSDDFDAFRKGIPLDYCIGSVHMVRSAANGHLWPIDGPEEHFREGLEKAFGGDIRRAVTAFYAQSIEMVETQPMEIIGHLDKVKMYNRGELFDTGEDWYRQLVGRLLASVARRGVIVEVNTRGVYTGKTDEYFPSAGVLGQCLHLGIPVMVNSDAHHPDELSLHVAEAEALLLDIGFKEVKTPFATAPIGKYS